MKKIPGAYESFLNLLVAAEMLDIRIGSIELPQSTIDAITNEIDPSRLGQELTTLAGVKVYKTSRYYGTPDWHIVKTPLYQRHEFDYHGDEPGEWICD